MIPKPERDEMRGRYRECCLTVSRLPDAKLAKRSLRDIPRALDALDEAEARIAELESDLRIAQNAVCMLTEDRRRLRVEIESLRNAHRQGIPR